ncbi:MAG: M48 family metallopeptidase [Verrucomicrobiales bacterium]|nr:M48 family metallopeptidase [Verrucomicrobiales bacterium]
MGPDGQMVRDTGGSFKKKWPGILLQEFSCALSSDHLSEELQGFDAYICHPQFGNEMVRGRFVVNRGALRFESSVTPFVLPLDQAVIELGDDDDWVALGDRRQPELKFFVARSILEDDHFVQAMPIRRQLEVLLGRRELLRRTWVTLGFLLAFGLIAWVGSMAAGWGVRSVVKGISVKHEMEFGDEVFKKIGPRLVLINDTNAIAQLETLAAPLLPAVPARGIPFKFYIAAGSPNAFALPGGRIVVTTGLIELLDKPEELLGVLAHESAHIAQRHAFQHMISGKGPVFLFEILTGSRNKMLNVMAYPSELLIYESFSQRYEKEADAFGWNYLVAAKINPHGMITALQKLKQSEKDLSFTNHASAFDSHPDLVKRIGWLEAKWAALPDKTNFMVLTNPLPKINVENKLNDRLMKLLSGGSFK